MRGPKLPGRQPRSTWVLPTEGPGAGAEQGSETSQGLLGARTPRAGPVLRAGPEAQLSWDGTVAVLCTRAAPCRPLEAPGEQRLSLYHQNLSAWSTAHAQRGWWANECVLMECRGCDPRVSFPLKKKKAQTQELVISCLFSL